MQRVAVINVVGLSPSLLGPSTPRLSAFAEKHGMQVFPPAFPALTCTAQSSMLTGTPPSEHGIVANGWYDRESAEVRFWKQSNHLVRGEKIWDHLRQKIPGFTCAQLFWWYNMYSTADITMTPRPLYPADGRKVFDIHTQPMDLREKVKADLGPFPFPSFWGPGAGIACSEWIAKAARWTEERESPTLSFVYLPHLDYCLQKFGPGAPEIAPELEAIDRVAGDLIDFLETRGVKVMVVSEYGISKVTRPIHLNRLFRKEAWIQVKNELGRETLDAGGCEVFAVADHQVAHIYAKQGPTAKLREFLESIDGVAEVRESIDGDRSGDFVVVAEPDAWFTYYFWEDDAKAPDFARCVDIHRKPGYDPAELFLDPEIPNPKWEIGKFLLKKKLGLRGLLEVIPLDASLVKGSHGRDIVEDGERPLILGSPIPVTQAEEVFGAIIAAIDP
ncbi:MAG: alkaline phosphatase family protein [Verrucomicrobia bacterium]|nr:MAG: alkaline phosphatase family protein [Verrucomicrobiota bacterium]TAE87668.1 MAG: alkaline phosphatase family protein [Verrucomicrobiota bacterium]TAF25397.1 MAG: alkaline phosphatase family protein [Verrucomicrobiota bacterium]TAF41184.1 MAG: alkaline phosphatase family protein [Verrucomicrobiota bacterium]